MGAEITLENYMYSARVAIGERPGGVAEYTIFLGTMGKVRAASRHNRTGAEPHAG